MQYAHAVISRTRPNRIDQLDANRETQYRSPCWKVNVNAVQNRCQRRVSRDISNDPAAASRPTRYVSPKFNLKQKNHDTFEPIGKRRKSRILNSDATNVSHSRTDTENHSNELWITAAIELPFDIETAFDSYANLTQQSSWTPWVKAVEYLDSNGDQFHTKTDSLLFRESLWTIKYWGFSMSWKARNTPSTRRPHVIEWRSTSGLKNSGRVDFRALGPNRTYMSLTVSCHTPTVLARSTTLAHLVKRQMIQPSLKAFRDSIMMKEVGVK
jgi:uncharacterized membrane protein